MPKLREQGYEDTDSKTLDIMKSYFRKISEYPLLTPEEEIRLGNIMCDRDPDVDAVTADDVLALGATQIGAVGMENMENFPIDA